MAFGVPKLSGHLSRGGGSRATGKRVKPFSDLAALNDAFDDALINFKVDVVELAMVDSDFRERVEKDFVVVQGGG
jgi:hypothetical protein